ncbi:MAG: hypothetical protein ABRQ38_27640 [Candidatus Eremiobacterota bacterium]
MESNTQLQLTQPQSIGLLDFDPNFFKETITRLETFKAIIMEVFKEGYHYGVIPGCKKPSLYLPGAELVCRGFKLLDKYDEIATIEDWDKGFFYYKVRCRLIVPEVNVQVTEGLGSCNSRENKYLYRWVGKKDIPPGVSESTLEKVEKDGQYGKYFMYKIENTNSCDLANTIMKMAKKRALVDAAKSIAGLSDIFTQDVEDLSYTMEPQSQKKNNGNGNGKSKETQQHNGVSKKAVELVKASVEFFGHPDLKEYVKNNYKTTSSKEFKDYFYNKATDAEIKAFENFLEGLKTKKAEQEALEYDEQVRKELQTEDQRKYFHKLCNDLAFDRHIYLEFAREKAGRKYLSTTKELTRAEMDIVISALEEKLQAPPDDYSSSLADEFCKDLTEEEAKAINDANRELAMNDEIPF